MATSFGNLATCGPTKRSFAPGEFPTKRFDSISGAGTTRLYGSKAFNATLQMSFLLNDADTTTFLNCWYDAKGTYDTLVLPPEFFDGASAVLDATIPDYLNWRWAEKPSVESVLPGRSRVSANFVATLDS